MEHVNHFFKVSCKNFPDAQKLSGWQCQPANQVFLPLHYHHCHCHRHHHHHRGRIVQNIGRLLVVGVIDVQAAKNEEEDPDQHLRKANFIKSSSSSEVQKAADLVVFIGN